MDNYKEAYKALHTDTEIVYYKKGIYYFQGAYLPIERNLNEQLKIHVEERYKTFDQRKINRLLSTEYKRVKR